MTVLSTTTLTNTHTQTTTSTTTATATATAAPGYIACSNPSAVGCSVASYCNDGAASGCVCEQTAEGLALCISENNEGCGASCTSSSECGAGYSCLVSTCCGAGSCFISAPALGDTCTNVARRVVRTLMGRRGVVAVVGVGLPMHLPLSEML